MNMKRTLGWLALGVLIVLPIAGGIVGTKILQSRTAAAAAAGLVMPPEPVNVAEVLERRWQPRVAAVGTVMAFQGTVVSSEADGVVREIRFEAGALVQAGEELVLLDAEAERAQGLIGSRAISQAELDLADASLKQARAEVDGIRALIAKKTVRAPFTGRLGIRRISIGQYLEKGSPLVSLQSLDPVYVEFSLPQQRLGELAQGLRVVVSSDAYPEQPFAGVITAVDPEVDHATRNVRVQATLPNPGNRLLPGMFVSVDMILARSETVRFIPATAVLHAPFGDTVFVVEEGEAGADGARPLVLRQQLVRLGARQGDFVAVTEGVRAGERVVATGAFKLRPGMAVVIDNTLAPSFTFAPKPRNS